MILLNQTNQCHSVTDKLASVLAGSAGKFAGGLRLGKRYGASNEDSLEAKMLKLQKL